MFGQVQGQRDAKKKKTLFGETEKRTVTAYFMQNVPIYVSVVRERLIDVHNLSIVRKVDRAGGKGSLRHFQQPCNDRRYRVCRVGVHKHRLFGSLNLDVSL